MNNHDERVSSADIALGRPHCYDHPIMDQFPSGPPVSLGRTLWEAGAQSPTTTSPVVKVLKVGAYDRVLHLFCGTPAQINEYGAKVIPGWESFSGGDDIEEARCEWIGKNFYVFFEVGRVNTKLIVHECFHLANAMLDSVGAFYGADNDEHGALLIEHLFDWCYTMLKARGEV